MRDRGNLVDRLAIYDTVVEIGVGNRPDLARGLASRGVSVTATDIKPCETPETVEFVQDDVTDPTPSVYAGADALVSRHLPPELHRPTAVLAADIDAVLCFTTLGGDSPLVPVSRETLSETTLFVHDPSAGPTA